jgi:hypothetical protein
MGSGQDAAIERKFAQVLAGQKLGFENVPLEKIFYVYRWAGSGSFHLSALAQTRKTDESEHDMAADYVAQGLGSGSIPSGQVVLKPRWKTDYVAMVSQYLKQTAARNTV